MELDRAEQYNHKPQLQKMPDETKKANAEKRWCRGLKKMEKERRAELLIETSQRLEEERRSGVTPKSILYDGVPRFPSTIVDLFADEKDNAELIAMEVAQKEQLLKDTTAKLAAELGLDLSEMQESSGMTKHDHFPSFQISFDRLGMLRTGAD